MLCIITTGMLLLCTTTCDNPWVIKNTDTLFNDRDSNPVVPLNTDMLWTIVPTTLAFGTSDIYSIAWGNGTFVAGGQLGSMAYSSDGVNWTSTASQFSGNNIFSIAYGIGVGFVAGGQNGQMAFSSNGTSWIDVTTTLFGSGSVLGIGYGNSKLLPGEIQAQ